MGALLPDCAVSMGRVPPAEMDTNPVSRSLRPSLQREPCSLTTPAFSTGDY